MAKKSINKKDNPPMEEVLWKACDALRGSIEQRIQACCPIIDIFEVRRAEIVGFFDFRRSLRLI